MKRAVGPIMAEPCTAAQQKKCPSSKLSYLKGRGMGREVWHEQWSGGGKAQGGGGCLGLCCLKW